MGKRRSTTIVVNRVDGDSVARVPDELAVEEPLEIHLDGTVVNTTMRTPGNDYELAVGFCHAEGLLHGMPVLGVRYCAVGSAVDTEFNVVTVETGGRAPVPTPRLGTTSSSCGLCGSTAIASLTERLAPFPAGTGLPLDLLRSMPERVLTEQGLFSRTGAVHAAAAFTADGTIELVREDVGRHNAVDKIVGRLVLDGRMPRHRLGLFVSGRASFEMVQKAWAGGFSSLVSVSAPTELAVATARAAGMTLVGFVRGDRCNVYAPERLAPREG